MASECFTIIYSKTVSINVIGERAIVTNDICRFSNKKTVMNSVGYYIMVCL